MEQTQDDKYTNMYWSKWHECEKLKKEIDELIIENNFIKRTLYTGKICHINDHNSYGKINNNETELYFHRTSCNFKLSQTMLNKSVKFNICMDNTSGKPKAINITYKPDDIYSKYVKESGFTQEELNGDEQVNEPKLEPNINGDIWEIYDTNVGHTDDKHKFPKNTPMGEVKKKCIEIGSRIFVAKVNCQYYIRSPPQDKKNRDYNSLKVKALERIAQGKHDNGWKTYLLNY
jgi:hypothetical protein